MYELTVLYKNGKERCVFNESFDVHSRHFSPSPTLYRIPCKIVEGYTNASQEANIYLMSNELAVIYTPSES